MLQQLLVGNMRFEVVVFERFRKNLPFRLKREEFVAEEFLLEKRHLHFLLLVLSLALV